MDPKEQNNEVEISYSVKFPDEEGFYNCHRDGGLAGHVRMQHGPRNGQGCPGRR